MSNKLNLGQQRDHAPPVYTFDPSCPPAAYKTPFTLLSGDHDPHCGVPSADFFQYLQKNSENPNRNKNFYVAARKSFKKRHLAQQAEMNSWLNLRAFESAFLQAMTEYEQFGKRPTHRPGIIERLFDRLNGKHRIQTLQEARQAAIDAHIALQEFKQRHIDLIRKHGYHGEFEGGPI